MTQEEQGNIACQHNSTNYLPRMTATVALNADKGSPPESNKDFATAFPLPTKKMKFHQKQTYDRLMYSISLILHGQEK